MQDSDIINIDVSPSLIPLQTASAAELPQPVFTPPPGTTFVSSLSGQTGSLVLSGGSTGFGFSAGGGVVTLSVTNAATVRSAIGLGSIATQNANSVAITGGTISGVTIGFGGGLHLLGYTSSTGDPTTTELPADKDTSIHKNTTSGNIFLAFNNGGTIVKVQLT